MTHDSAGDRAGCARGRKSSFSSDPAFPGLVLNRRRFQHFFTCSKAGLALHGRQSGLGELLWSKFCLLNFGKMDRDPIAIASPKLGSSNSGANLQSAAKNEQHMCTSILPCFDQGTWSNRSCGARFGFSNVCSEV